MLDGADTVIGINHFIPDAEQPEWNHSDIREGYDVAEFCRHDGTAM
jgi:hypothetical protein